MRGGSRVRWLFLVSTGLAVVLVAVLASFLSALHTSAQPVEGEDYTGTHSAGGTVEFSVSSNGSRVEGFTATNVPCNSEKLTWPPVGTIPIVDDAFSENIVGTIITGSFPSLGRAQGTFKMVIPEDPPVPGCESPELTWTATAPTPTPASTPTPTPTPTPTATASPSPTPTPDATGLVAGWNHVCYLGPTQDIQGALADIVEKVQAVYSLRPGQGYDKWFPGRAEISTISTLDPYQSLLLLLSDDASWPQQPSGPEPSSADLEQGWNSVCYAGETTDLSTVTQSIDGQFGVVYALGSSQGWQRFVPGRADISNLTQLTRFASVLILVTQQGGTEWSFGP